MRYVFLVNSFSLKDKTLDMIKKVDNVCKKRKMDYVIEINSFPYILVGVARRITAVS